MKRKHSIALGIGAVVSILYSVLLICYVYDTVQKGNSALESALIRQAVKTIVPHIGGIIASTILCIIAFFSNIFGVALACSICFGVSAILGLNVDVEYVLLSLPSILFSVVGCLYTFKRKQRLQEEAEEAAYRKEHPQKQKKRSQPSSYAQRQMNQDGYEEQQPSYVRPAQTGYGTHQYAQPYTQPTVPYAMNQASGNYQNQRMNPMVAMPYEPATFQPMAPTFIQAHANMDYRPLELDPQVSYGTVNPYAQTPYVQNPYAGVNPYAQQPIADPMYGTDPFLQGVASPYASSINQGAPAPSATMQISEGYFDDYGNFHPR